MKKLKEGEVICSDCDGHGSYRIRMRTHICSKCNGKGKMDWVSNVMGRVKATHFFLNNPPDTGVYLYYKGTKVFKTSERGIE
jgi:RecJ-like exonuclease